MGDIGNGVRLDGGREKEEQEESPVVVGFAFMPKKMETMAKV